MTQAAARVCVPSAPPPPSPRAGCQSNQCCGTWPAAREGAGSSEVCCAVDGGAFPLHNRALPGGCGGCGRGAQVGGRGAQSATCIGSCQSASPRPASTDLPSRQHPQHLLAGGIQQGGAAAAGVAAALRPRELHGKRGRGRRGAGEEGPEHCTGSLASALRSVLCSASGAPIPCPQCASVPCSAWAPSRCRHRRRAQSAAAPAPGPLPR